MVYYYCTPQLRLMCALFLCVLLFIVCNSILTLFSWRGWELTVATEIPLYFSWRQNVSLMPGPRRNQCERGWHRNATDLDWIGLPWFMASESGLLWFRAPESRPHWLRLRFQIQGPVRSNWGSPYGGILPPVLLFTFNIKSKPGLYSKWSGYSWLIGTNKVVDSLTDS